MKAIPNIFATQPAGNVPASYLDVDFALIADAGTFSNYFVDTGAANAYVVTFAAGETGSLTAGMMIQFLASADNTGASTFAVNGMTAKNITNYDASALAAGQIKTGAVVSVMYDGTQFKLVTQFTGGKVPGLTDFSGGGIALGTNHISNGGTAAGLSFDSSNNATFSADLKCNTFSRAGAYYVFTNMTSGAGSFPTAYNTVSGALTYNTSSLRFKTDLIPFSIDEARKITFGRNAFSYSPKTDTDDPTERFVGYASEDIAEIDKRFATFEKHESGNIPAYVSYERFVVPHGVILEDHEERIKKLEALVAKLTA